MSSRCCPAACSRNDEVFDLQSEVGRPFTWTALLTIKGIPYHQKVVEEHDAARARGVEVWPQVSCRPLVFQMNMAEPFTLNIRESFRKLMDVPKEERIAAYRDPAWRESTWQELQTRAALPFNFDALSIAESTRHPELVDRKVVDIAAERGDTPLDVLLDLSLEEDLTTRFWSVLANDDPEGIAWLLPQDSCLLGLADSGAHVSQLCDACFSTDLLGNWVRDKEVMPLPKAIHKLTGEPASVYGLADRGTLEVGKAADIAVFDFDTVAPGPLRRVVDFPANGERLTADQPVGMIHTLVNGTPIRVDGVADADALHTRPGAMLCR